MRTQMVQGTHVARVSETEICDADYDSALKREACRSIQDRIKQTRARQRTLERQLRHLDETVAVRDLCDRTLTRQGALVNIVVIVGSVILVVLSMTGYSLSFRLTAVAVAASASAWFGRRLFTPADADIPERVASLDKEREKTIADRENAESGLWQARKDSRRYQRLRAAQNALHPDFKTSRAQSTGLMNTQSARLLRISISTGRNRDTQALKGLCLLIAIGLGGLSGTHPGLATVCAFVLVPLAVVALVSWRRPARCTVCGNLFKRNAYRWEIDHTKEWLCVPCNERMERRQSAERFGSHGSGSK